MRRVLRNDPGEIMSGRSTTSEVPQTYLYWGGYWVNSLKSELLLVKKPDSLLGGYWVNSLKSELLLVKKPDSLQQSEKQADIYFNVCSNRKQPPFVFIITRYIPACQHGNTTCWCCVVESD